MSNALYLEHHGVKGQRWGVRRYQNADGSLTSAGKLRYDQNDNGELKKISKQEKNKRIDDKRSAVRDALSKKLEQEYDDSEEGKVYKKWRKSHPHADADDFGDYLADHHEIPGFETKQREALHDHSSLDKKHARNMTIGAALVSSFYLAPVAAIIGGSAADKGNKGKAAAIAALATIGTVTLSTYASAKKDTIKAEKKYGLR